MFHTRKNIYSILLNDMLIGFERSLLIIWSFLFDCTHNLGGSYGARKILKQYFIDWKLPTEPKLATGMARLMTGILQSARRRSLLDNTFLVVGNWKHKITTGICRIIPNTLSVEIKNGYEKRSDTRIDFW
jgi:hypothetical protein